MGVNPYESPEQRAAGLTQCGFSHTWRLLGLGLAATAVVFCMAAIMSTLGMEAIAAANYNPGIGNIVILGGWNSVAYIVMTVAALGLSRSVGASFIMLTGTIVVSGLSLFALFNVLSPYFTPPSVHYRPPMNCAGPAEIVIPFVQLPLSIVFITTACFLRRF